MTTNNKPFEVDVISNANRFREEFNRVDISDEWDIAPAPSMTVSTNTYGLLTIDSGTTLEAVTVLTSKRMFKLPLRVSVSAMLSQRIINQTARIELVSVGSDKSVDLDDNNKSRNMAAMVFNGASATVSRFETRNGGGFRRTASVSPAQSTATFGIHELEISGDEGAYYSRALQSAGSRNTAMGLAQTPLPNPEKFYKLRIRFMNRQEIPVTAVINNGGVARVTCTAHGQANGNVVKLEEMLPESLNGTWTVTVVDANTLELQGSVFAAGYPPAAGATHTIGYVVPQIAPLSTTVLSIGHIATEDYTELMTEITGGRGQVNTGSAIPVAVTSMLAASPTGTGSNTVQGTAAHDAVAVGNPLYLGGIARTANATGVASGDAAGALMNVVGAQVVLPYAIPESTWQYGSSTAATGTADVVVKAAAAAGIRNYMTSLQYQNTSGVASVIVVKDGSTVIWAGVAPASMAVPANITFPVPLRGTAATAMNVALLTTATNTIIAAQGFVAP